ncbi:MAG TPA: rRNA maturation RNase YbeY [Candidatus Dojkabacteria bacterium]|nr:rRNA maturation RNase YbeY [Candidatus Dojkabacteria bacterium]
MKLEIFNWPNISLLKSKVINSLKKEFSSFDISAINVIFVDEKEMQRLNKEYRNVDDVTDVLSFNLDAEGFLGEIYICPKYVKKTVENYEEEIIRLIVHGILHLLGFEHKTKLDDISKQKEDMFVKQEEILENILRDLK